MGLHCLQTTFGKEDLYQLEDGHVHLARRSSSRATVMQPLNPRAPYVPTSEPPCKVTARTRWANMLVPLVLSCQLQTCRYIRRLRWPVDTSTKDVDGAALVKITVACMAQIIAWTIAPLAMRACSVAVLVFRCSHMVGARDSLPLAMASVHGQRPSLVVMALLAACKFHVL